MTDLIGDNISIQWSGTKGSVKGDIKYVSDYSELFGEAEKSGNFFPVSLSSTYQGKEITVQRKNGTAKTANDTEWILRLSDGTNTQYDINCEGKEIASLTFADATLGVETGADHIKIKGQGETAVYGSKKVSELMDEDVTIDWVGTSGTVKGTFHHITDWNELPKAPYEGHFFVFDIDRSYFGKPFTFIKGDNESTTTVDAASEDEMSWVLRIDDTKKFIFKSGEDTIAELDFSQATLSD